MFELDFTEVEKALKEVLLAVRTGSEEGVEQVVTEIKNKAQSRVPVDTGTLKASAKTQVTASNDEVVGETSFNTDYAVFVEYNLEARHPVGQALFLTSSANEVASKTDKIIAEQVSKELR